MLNIFENKSLNVLASGYIMPKRVTSFWNAHLRLVVPGLHSFCRINVAAVASCWLHFPILLAGDLNLLSSVLETKAFSLLYLLYFMIDK